MTKFSERVRQAKDALGLSNERIVEKAAKAGYPISKYTVTVSVNGDHGQVKPSTVEALAYALEIPRDELAELAGLPQSHGHFRLEGQIAEYADALTKPQADAVREIIRLLAEGNRQAAQQMSLHEAGEGLQGTRRWMQRTGQLDEEVAHDEDSEAPMSEAGDPATDDDYELAAHEGERGIDPDELPHNT